MEILKTYERQLYVEFLMDGSKHYIVAIEKEYLSMCHTLICRFSGEMNFTRKIIKCRRNLSGNVHFLSFTEEVEVEKILVSTAYPLSTRT